MSITEIHGSSIDAELIRIPSDYTFLPKNGIPT